MSTSTPQVAGGRFALFADCLLVGCFTAVAAVPMVTAYPALVAACSVLRERVAEDRSIGPKVFLARVGQVVRSGLSGLVVPPLVVLLVLLDAGAIARGVPGSGLFAVVLAVAGAATITVGLRMAARWRVGVRWAALFREVRSHQDFGGSVQILVAAASAVGIVVLVPLTALLVAGPLAMAAVAVESRRR